MLNLLVRYRVVTNRGGGFISGTYINVYWDDSADALEVQKFDDASDTSGTIITTGPDLGAFNIDSVVVSGFQDPTGGYTFLQYRFCDGTTLSTFHIQSLFPYVQKIDAANHEACAVDIVCDLTINDNYTTQQASGPNANDGAISVTADSSNGTIKFALDDPEFDYGYQGQESGDFAGILPGVHTVTAKDAAGCFDQIEIEVKYNITYGVLYRLEYDDINGNGTRVDILERDYTGDIEDVCGDGKPFVLKYEGDGELDKFKPVIPSTGALTLMSEINFKFRHLFTQDDRKYQMRYYKNYGVPDPGFTPDTLDALNLWTNLDNGGPAWTTGAVPYVEFTGTAAGAQSDWIVTQYTFEAGKGYTFSFQLRGGDSSTIATSATAYIQILDSSNNVLSERIVSMDQTFPLEVPKIVTGEYSFVATSGSEKIAVAIVSTYEITNTMTWFVDSFENETEAIPSSDWQFKWMGYVIGDNYSEAYLAPPYPVTIVATDGLADLKNFDFLDVNDRKYREDITSLNAIRDILSRTDLGINIQCGINRYEESMDQGASDDPLTQSMFNPATFYHDGETKNCLEVLQEILKPFGSRILQRNGKWFITSVEEHLAAIDYREFDSDGKLIGVDQINDAVDFNIPVLSDRAAFRDRDQVIETVPAFGKMFFEHTLLKNASLIASHGFEIDDVSISPEGFTVFKNWNANISSAPGVEYGIKETKSFEGDFNFYVRGIDGAAGGGPFKLTSIDFQIEFSNEDVFELSFDYATLLLIGAGPNPYWVRIKWLLKIGDYYFSEYVGWTDDGAVDPYNHIYVSKYNDNQNFKIRDNFRNVVNSLTESGYLEIVFEGVGIHDFEIVSGGGSYDELKNIATTNLSSGHKIRGLYTAESPNNVGNWYYLLEESDEAEDAPNVIRPDDYNGTTNRKIWRLERKEITNKVVQYNYLDNVVLLHFPNKSEPPLNITVEKTNNKNIKLNFEGQYLLNDIDTTNINNSERTYKNFFKKLDGTPTQVWARTYRPGEGKLLDLLANDFASQYKLRSNKLTGSFISDKEVLPTSIMTEVNDGDRKYLFMGYELNDKDYSIRFDLLQLGNVLDEDGEAIDAGFTTGFSLGFRS
jgi:hypothetical protein